jgi:hypothetical protein
MNDIESSVLVKAEFLAISPIAKGPLDLATRSRMPKRLSLAGTPFEATVDGAVHLWFS